MVIVRNPPVNALNREGVHSITNSLRAAESDHSAKALILAAMGRTFIAGADLNEYRNIDASSKRHECLLIPLLLEQRGAKSATIESP